MSILEELRVKLAREKSFLGVSTTQRSGTDKDFVELFERDLKRLKVGERETVIAEMKDGKEYYILPTYNDIDEIFQSRQ
ncbi:hypothetical protein [Paenibacillus lautus]|uniref:hypothetical protein n=1 Tax=Paenibacillus lautus TaxID=1401 RepID=UPI003D29617A